MVAGNETDRHLEIGFAANRGTMESGSRAIGKLRPVRGTGDLETISHGSTVTAHPLPIGRRCRLRRLAVRKM